MCYQVLQSPFSPIQLPQTRRKQTCLTILLLKVLQQIISDCLDYMFLQMNLMTFCVQTYFLYYKKWMAPKALQLRDMSWYMHVSPFLKRKRIFHQYSNSFLSLEKITFKHLKPSYQKLQTHVWIQGSRQQPKSGDVQLVLAIRIMWVQPHFFREDWHVYRKTLTQT